MRIDSRHLFSIVPFLLMLAHLNAETKIRIVTTTPDLADITENVGGDAVNVVSLAKGFQNPHFVDAKPSLILKLMKADVYIKTGMDLEIGWAPLLERGARNRRIRPGGPGFIDASEIIEAKEIPSHPSRAHGDVHPQGNPHYLLDPENAKKVAVLIAAKLAGLYPDQQSAFQSRCEAYVKEIDRRMTHWIALMKPFRETAFISYHKVWIYFADRFGLRSMGEIEPYPGIPPTPAHTASLIDTVKSHQVKLILTQPWFERRTPDSIAEETGADVLVMSIMPGGVEKTSSYLESIDYNIRLIIKTLGE